MPTTWTLEDLYKGIARGWRALAIVVLVCMLLAFAAFRVFPEKYAATAVHTVEPISVLSSGSSFATVNMDTEQIVATSTGVLQAAADALADGTSVRDLRGATQLEVPRGSQVLRFIVTTSSPGTSAAWANAIASAYGTQRSEAARAVVEQTSDELQRTIDALRERLDGLESGSPEAAATELQLEALVGEQARLLSTPFYAGTLITPAVEPTDSERPSVLVFAAGGLFLGLLLGSFAALLWSGRASRRDSNLAERSPSPIANRHASGAPRRPAITRTGSNRVQTAAPHPTDQVHNQVAVTAASGPGRGRSASHAATGSQPGIRTGSGLPAQRRRQSNRR